MPCLAGGVIWATYIGVRTLVVHNEIVINKSKENKLSLFIDDRRKATSF